MKRILLALSLVSLITIISCSKDNSIDFESKSTSKSSLRVIDESEIPEGVTPIVISNEEELDDFIAKINSLNLKIADEYKPKGLLKSASENGGRPGNAFQVADLANNADSQITITHSWAQKGAHINVSSHNANTWYFSSWTQESGVANWSDSNRRIYYSVSGVIKFYVICSWEFIEINRLYMATSGNFNI